MLDFFNKDSFFYFSALLGTGLFVIRFILSLFLSDSDDFDDGDGDFDDAGNIRWFSIQTVTGFIMMFGWAGLTCHRQFELNSFLAFSIAFLVGVGAMFITSYIFKFAKKFKSTGTVFEVEDSIGREALVYQRIPEEGVGKITISIKDITRELDAISLNKEVLNSFTRVQIIKKMDNKTVFVIPKK